MLELAILGLLEEQALHGYELRRRLGETLGLLVSVSFGSLYPALARLEAAGAVVAVTPEPGNAEHGVEVRGGGPEPGTEAEGGSRAGGEAREVPGTGDRRGEVATRIPMTGSLTGERAAFRSTRAITGRATSGRATSRSLGGHVTSARSTRQRRVYSITESGIELFNRLLAGEGDQTSAEDDRGFALRLAFARHLSPEARLRLLERRRAVLTQRRARSSANRTAATFTDTWRAALAERGSEALDSDINWLDRLIEAERTRSEPAEPVDADPTSVASSSANPSSANPSSANPSSANPSSANPSSAGKGVVPDPVEPIQIGAVVSTAPADLASRKVPS